MKNVLLLIVAVVLSGCVSAPENPNAELVMEPGDTIVATTNEGTIRISYVERLKRRYQWYGFDRTFRHQTRLSRWYGSLGMYRPRGDGTMHAVLEEGQQHFTSVSEAMDWIAKEEGKWDHVWTRDGLVVGWLQQGRPSDGYPALHVNVWQILVNGRKPTLPDASPTKIRSIKAQE